MITIICGTNRPNNETQKFVATYEALLKSKKQEVKVLYLDSLPVDFVFRNNINKLPSDELNLIINTFIAPVNKIVVVSPEYNGSFPGILKSFIDCVEPALFKNKLIALVGLGSGRGGNLRGNDHLTGIFNYLKAFVVPVKIAIPQIWNVTDSNGILNHEGTLSALNEQIDSLINTNL